MKEEELSLTHDAMTDYTSSPSRPASPAVPLPDISTARPLPYRFSWDPTSRRPGPASVSEITEGRGDYFTSTPKVDIYGASSSTATSQLGTVPQQWSSAKHGFHGTFAVCWRMVYFVNRDPRLSQPFPRLSTTLTRNPRRQRLTLRSLLRHA